MTIVDVHCHSFNADDIPARGFVQRVLLRNIAVLKLAAEALDALGQGMAPGFAQEDPELSRMLTTQVASRAILRAPQPSLDAEANDLLTHLRETQPGVVNDAEAELAAEAGQDAASADRALFGADRALLVVKWVVLIGKARWRITSMLMDTYPEVDLFVSMLVDLEPGLHDIAPASIREQVELHEKVSRLSMLGRLTNGRARVHPFIGFDPRRELASRKRADLKGPLALVKEAVCDYGYVGVKLYPPMGFRPMGNQATSEMTSEEGAAVDEILHELYKWCEEEHVPVTAHCNPSNEAAEEYINFSEPANWAKVLTDHPELRLDFGHFGGLQITEAPDRWPEEFAALIADHHHVYADTGNHDTDHRTNHILDLDAYLGVLKALFTQFPDAQGRFMFGTDWYMNALHPKYGAFLDEYRSRFTTTFGDQATERFLGEAALEYLGFKDPDNHNCQRLWARYQTYAADDVPAWLTRPTDSDAANPPQDPGRSHG